MQRAICRDCETHEGKIFCEMLHRERRRRQELEGQFDTLALLAGLTWFALGLVLTGAGIISLLDWLSGQF